MFKTMSLKAAANPMIIAGKSAAHAVAADHTCWLISSDKDDSRLLAYSCSISVRAPEVIICRAINPMDGSWVELLHQSSIC